MVIDEDDCGGVVAAVWLGIFILPVEGFSGERRGTAWEKATTGKAQREKKR